MKFESKIAVPYSLILLMDRRHGTTPDTMSGQLVTATSSCIAIGTLPDCDGETSIVLTNQEKDIAQTLFLVFNGVIETPNHEISVCTPLNEEVIKLSSDNDNSHVRVWVNDDKTPDRIEIAIG